jgi:CheY-like chemotaxis protein
VGFGNWKKTCQNPARQAIAIRSSDYSDTRASLQFSGERGDQQPPIAFDMASASVTMKVVVVADDTAFVRDRFRTAVENAGHKAILIKSAPELLARVQADLATIDLLVLDLRLPQASGVGLVRAIRKLDGGKLPILIFSGTIASANEVRELASLGVAGYVNEYSAVQHIVPALAGGPGYSHSVPVREHDRCGVDIEPQSRRHRDPHHEPAREQRQNQSAVSDAGLEEGHRCRRPRRLERPPRRDGCAVRKAPTRQSGPHRPVRRCALFQQPQSLRMRIW